VPAMDRRSAHQIDWNESAGLCLSSRFCAQGVRFEHARPRSGIARDGGCTSHPGGICRTWPTRRGPHCRAPAHRARQERCCACPRPNETKQSSAAGRLNGIYRRTLTAQPCEFQRGWARASPCRRRGVRAAAMPGFPGRVCPDRNSFLVPRTEQDFGLHTSSERRNLKIPGLEGAVSVPRYFEPGGPLVILPAAPFIVERASALYSSLIIDIPFAGGLQPGVTLAASAIAPVPQDGSGRLSILTS
jgi:hypothetical protein